MNDSDSQTIGVFDIDELLDSSKSSSSEDEDPDMKFKSGFVMSSFPKLEINFAADNIEVSTNMDSASRKVSMTHDDGQSTHVSSRASCIETE